MLRFRIGLSAVCLIIGLFFVLQKQFVASADEGGFHFTGIIEKLPSTPGHVGDWQVSGRLVRVSARTKIEEEHGQAAVGAFVEVEGESIGDGSINAEEIHVERSPNDDSDDNPGGSGRYIKLYGLVQNLPSGLIGEWTVGGQRIIVTPGTKIEQEDGVARLGANVEIEGSQQSDGSILASKIEVKNNDGSDDSSRYIEFISSVEKLPSTSDLTGEWRIGGRTVTVSARTFIDKHDGSPAVGSSVEVKGSMKADGSIDAVEIEVKSSMSRDEDYSKLYGLIDALPSSSNLVGDWRIGGRIVRVSALTYIDRQYGAPLVGAYVEAEGIDLPDGSLNASKIEIRQRSDDKGSTYFFGIVEDLPSQASLIGDWVVSGRTVHVGSSTRIVQKAASIKAGARVKIKSAQEADGSVTAFKIAAQK